MHPSGGMGHGAERCVYIANTTLYLRITLLVELLSAHSTQQTRDCLTYSVCVLIAIDIVYVWYVHTVTDRARATRTHTL